MQRVQQQERCLVGTLCLWLPVVALIHSNISVQSKKIVYWTVFHCVLKSLLTHKGIILIALISYSYSISKVNIKITKYKIQCHAKDIISVLLSPQKNMLCKFCWFIKKCLLFQLFFFVLLSLDLFNLLGGSGLF